MKKVLFTLLALALPLLVSATSYTDNTTGIIYDLTGKGSMKVAKVTGTTDALKATKVLNIPSTVNDGADTYTVTTICNGSLTGVKQIYVDQSDIVWDNGMPYYGNNYLNSEYDDVNMTQRYYYFEYQSWDLVKIPASITTIEENAATMCSINTLDVADLAAWCSINIASNSTDEWNQISTFINPKNFSINGVLERNLTIPSTVTSISKGLFSGFRCFDSVAIPGSVESIGRYAFWGCSMTSLTLAEGISTIGRYAFSNCDNLVSVTIPESFEDNNGNTQSCFAYCQNLTTAIIKGYVAQYMFDGCSKLANVTIDSKYSQISGYAFHGTGIVSIEIPNSITYISNYAFADCSKLKTVSIKRNVIVDTDKGEVYSNYLGICGGSFSNCPLLEDFYCEVPFKNVQVDFGNPFENSHLEEGATLHVRADDINSYKTTDPWSQFPYVKALSGTTPPTPPVVPDDITATIESLGWATLYSEYALDFSGVTGLKAYIVSAFTPANNHVILTQVTNVPANTGVVLVGSAGNYTIPTTTTETYVANMLKGVKDDTMMWSSDGTNKNYILANGSKGVGFYVIQDGTTLEAGKAYLAIPNTSSAAPQFVPMDIEGTITGIKNIDADVTGKAVFNLSGQRQSGLKKGINIVGSKKIVVK